MYIASTGTVRLRSGTAFRLQCSSEQIILEADLPVTLGYAPGCGQMSFTNTRLMRQPHPLPGSERTPTASLRNFDFTLDYFLRTYGAGFSREVQGRAGAPEPAGARVPVPARCRCPPPRARGRRRRRMRFARPPPQRKMCVHLKATQRAARAPPRHWKTARVSCDPFTSCSSSSPPTCHLPMDLSLPLIPSRWVDGLWVSTMDTTLP